MRDITIALAKGRLAELTIDLLEQAGLDVSELRVKSRKLIFSDNTNHYKFILVKASDVPTYVEYGAADIGVVGRDTLLEEGRNLYELIDLGFGACKMCVCGPESLRGKLDSINNMRVASKYVNIAKNYYTLQKKQSVELIKLNGSVELAPLTGLSEVIVDIVESGKTLKENGLVVLEEVCDLSARFVVNRVSMKMEKDRILSLVERIQALIS